MALKINEKSDAFKKGSQIGTSIVKGSETHSETVFNLVKDLKTTESFETVMSEFQAGMRKSMKNSGMGMPKKYRQWKSDTLALTNDFHQGSIKEVLKLGSFSKIDGKLRKARADKKAEETETETETETQSASEASDNSQAENPEVPTLTLTGLQADMLNKIDSELILDADKKTAWDNIFKVIENALKDQEKLNTSKFPPSRLKANISKMDKKIAEEIDEALSA